MHPTPRRRLILAAASLVAGPALLRPSQAQQPDGAPLPPTPRQTEGPFYPAAFEGDADADLLDRGGRLYRQGQPAWLQGRLLDTAGRAIDRAVVEVWQCDHEGHYRHARDGNRADAAFQGYGRATVGRDGRYRFRTIRPVAYTGRTPHIHVKVLHGGRELLTTQLYVQGETGNARDFLWRSLDDTGRAALTRPFRPGADGLEADFPIVVAG